MNILLKSNMQIMSHQKKNKMDHIKVIRKNNNKDIIVTQNIF